MSAWTVGSVTYADPAGLASAHGIAAGKFWHGDVEVFTPRYERRVFAYPGVNGLAVKSFGYRGREVRGQVLYVSATLSALRAAVEADRSALANTTFSTTPPDGVALTNCQLVALPDGPISPAGGGLFLMRTALELLQLR
jgi:hypothetical protein